MHMNEVAVQAEAYPGFCSMKGLGIFLLSFKYLLSYRLKNVMALGKDGFSFRKRVQSYCLMDLRNFPMDEQTCELSIQSCKYSPYSKTAVSLFQSWRDTYHLLG